jgi:hypothetical protein
MHNRRLLGWLNQFAYERIYEKKRSRTFNRAVIPDEGVVPRRILLIQRDGDMLYFRQYFHSLVNDSPFSQYGRYDPTLAVDIET